MTPNSIRDELEKIAKQLPQSERATFEYMQLCATVEIAAQLADLNEQLRALRSDVTLQVVKGLFGR